MRLIAPIGLLLSYCVSVAIANKLRNTEAAVRKSGLCAPIWEKCDARKVSICGGYGFPMQRGPSCLAAVQAGVFQDVCSKVGSENSCRSWKEECDGCGGSGYPDPEQVCTNKCQACATVEDYHGMNCALR
mmetsp:Transcript_125564/g.313758  ORF Transcript_125564/g.313758 Transcript_125564/m.313758 type:complete len:130 (-) Transcript_125564:36-425(-)